MSEQKPEQEETTPEGNDEDVKDLDVPTEDAESVKGGQDMPPIPRR